MNRVSADCRYSPEVMQNCDGKHDGRRELVVRLFGLPCPDSIPYCSAFPQEPPTSQTLPSSAALCTAVISDFPRSLNLPTQHAHQAQHTSSKAQPAAQWSVLEGGQDQQSQCTRRDANAISQQAHHVPTAVSPAANASASTPGVNVMGIAPPQQVSRGLDRMQPQPAAAGWCPDLPHIDVPITQNLQSPVSLSHREGQPPQPAERAAHCVKNAFALHVNACA